MAFRNRIRLPIKVTRPQFQDERGTFRKANGETKTQFVVIKKQYEGETDWMSEKMHEKLVIALGHDIITIEGDKYLGGITKEGDYDIQWQDFLDYPTAKAKFKVNVTPFAATNSNCQTCEQATQLDLQNDTFLIDLQENQTYTLFVAFNDEICCFPAVFSLVSFNTTYLSSASIDQNGVITVHTKTGLTSANNIVLAVYKVTCPNGGYDEANVYANIDGTIEGCPAPTNVEVIELTSDSVKITWTGTTPAPANGYTWELYKMDTPGTPVANGVLWTALEADIASLEDGTDYGFYIKSVCDGSESAFVELLFTTPVASDNCGEYQIEFFDPDGLAGAMVDVTYVDCEGNDRFTRVRHNTPKSICALQSSPGNPISIVGSETIFITYIGPC